LAAKAKGYTKIKRVSISFAFSSLIAICLTKPQLYLELLIYLSDESKEIDLEDINNLIKSNGHKELTRTCGNNYAI